MGLLDEAAAEIMGGRPRCSVALLRTTDPPVAAELDDALSREDLPAAAISRALAKRGVRISAGTLSRHRNKGCSCH